MKKILYSFAAFALFFVAGCQDEDGVGTVNNPVKKEMK